ncbi:hypothetical protein C8Q79DRAFT_1012158 [Trametes meyenii]|nr:hypothetical protein C8Q79DRAFT_1012158 [Trametes meyenii]
MNLPRLAELCELYFTWGNSTEILKTFRTAIWPGEALRMFINEGLERTGSAIETRSLLHAVVDSVDDPPAFSYCMCHVKLTDNGFGSFVVQSAVLEEVAKPSTISLPALIVERARPELVNPAYPTEGYIGIAVAFVIAIPTTSKFDAYAALRVHVPEPPWAAEGWNIIVDLWICVAVLTGKRSGYGAVSFSCTAVPAASSSSSIVAPAISPPLHTTGPST